MRTTVITAVVFAGWRVVACSAQECDSSSGICDQHERCPVWKDEGECLRSRDYMKKECPVSCASEDTSLTFSSSNDCVDQHERCSVWASLGECDTNKADMIRYCPKSCDVCAKGDGSGCQDMDQRCSSWAKSGECASNPTYMHINCAKSCDTCDRAAAAHAARGASANNNVDDGDNGESSTEFAISEAYARNLMDRSRRFGEEQRAEGGERDHVLRRIESTISYLASDKVKQLPENIRRECLNREGLCTFWQILGECERNEKYMHANCAAACHACETIQM